MVGRGVHEEVRGVMGVVGGATGLLSSIEDCTEFISVSELLVFNRLCLSVCLDFSTFSSILSLDISGG